MQKTHTAIGLDLGGQAVKLVRLSMTPKGLRVDDAVLRLWPDDLSEDLEARAIWLGELLQSLKIRGPRVALAVSGSVCNVQLVEFPKSSEASLAKMTQMEVERLAGISQQDAASGFLALPSEGSPRIPTLIALCRAATIENEIKLATDAGASVEDVSLSNLALFGALTYKPRPHHQGLVVFVDIGRDSTNISLSNNGALVFARSFASGGGAFTSSVANAASISMDEAEQWKQIEGQLFLEGIPTDPKGEALLQAAESWLAEFNETLAHFFERSAGEFASYDSIVLSGGGAMQRHFSGWLEERTSRRVEILAPLKALGANTDSIAPELEVDSRFAVATGLALQGLKLSPTLSLLPPSIKERRSARRRTRQLVAYTAMASLIFVTLLLAAMNEVGRVNRSLETQHEGLRRCQQIAANIEDLRDKSQQISDMLQPIADLANRGERLLVVWRDICSQRKGGDWFTLFADGGTYFAGVKKSDASPPPPGPSRGGGVTPSTPAEAAILEPSVVILEGYTQDRLLRSLNIFTRALEEKCPEIKKADTLREDRRIAQQSADEWWAKTGHRRFTLELQLDWTHASGRTGGAGRTTETSDPSKGGRAPAAPIEGSAQHP